MPDPTRQTVSATQVPALLNASPYLTRWLLWRHFKHGDETDPQESGRMTWGKRMQPVILAAVADEMNLEVTPNDDDAYIRNASLRMGCTPDGEICDMNRGLGAVECKNIDWLQWRDKWTDDGAPDHIEIQIQAQMLVCGYTWGVIAPLVGGNDLRLYHREPDLKLHEQMIAVVSGFFASLEAGDEPDPLGRADELPLWRRTREYAPEPEALDLTESRLASELLHELAYWQGMAGQATKMVKARKARLEFLAGDKSPVRAWGKTAWIKHSQTRPSEISLPMDLRQHLAELHDINEALLPESQIMSDAHSEALAVAIGWTHITRRGGATVRIDVKDAPTVGEPPWTGEDDLALHL